MTKSVVFAAAALAGALAVAYRPATAGDDPFDECLRRVVRTPDEGASWSCFLSVARGNDRWDEAARHLEQVGASHPDNAWMTLSRAMVAHHLNDPRTEELYRRAISGFQQRAHEMGEAIARQNLVTHLNSQGRFEEAEMEIRSLEHLAARSRNPKVTRRARLARVQTMIRTEQDLSGAYRRLKRIYRAVGQGKKAAEGWRIALVLLGNAAHGLGRYQEAIRFYQEIEELLEGAETDELAIARFNLANSLLESKRSLPHPGVRDEVLAAFKRALETSVKSGHASVEAGSRAALGELLAHQPEGQKAARDHLKKCVRVAERARRPGRGSVCWRHLSLVEVRTDPALADRHLDRAIELALEAQEPSEVALAWRARSRLKMLTGRREYAVEDGFRLLEVIENLRDLERGGLGRAGVFSRWVSDYYWLSGELLQGRSRLPAEGEVDRAFEVIERFRARVLLERLTTLGSRTIEGVHLEPSKERVAILKQISLRHRRLLRRSLSVGEQEALAAELVELNRKEADLRDRIEDERRPGATDSSDEFATLSDVQSLLAGDEALLSFQVGLWKDLFGSFAGGAWLVVVTRDGVRVHRSADRVRLETLVPLFTGLFDDRDEGEVRPSVAAYRALFGDALRELPESTSRLVIVPDGCLHQLPFASLREAPSEAPLGARYALSQVPSATVWMRWRRGRMADTEPGRELEEAAKTVWAFADPEFGLSETSGAIAAHRSWVSNFAGPLGRLPFARSEGRRVVRTVGGASTLAVGPDASERALKAGAPSDFAILHFATHAVVDEEHPESSAILLAAGDSDSEDGLLQPREISDLDLKNRIVVLAGCQTASGKLMSGEGVLGLARSFFEAGATSVVASLWPLRDDEGERFFGEMYDHLSKGGRLDRAVQLAQQRSIKRGAPGAAWAGLVLLGDGSVVPFPNGSPAVRRRQQAMTLVFSAALFALLLMLTAVRLRRRRGTASSNPA